MMKIVTIDQMRQFEIRADSAGVAFGDMMENAGRAVADAISLRWDVRGRRILVLVGPGNNGGDGLVAAYHLSMAGGRVALYLWKREGGMDALLGRAVEHSGAATFAEHDADFAVLHAELDRCAIVVDALLGTGANRPIEGLLKAILTTVRGRISDRTSKTQVSHLQSPVSNLGPVASLTGHPGVVAVDLPSGLNADTGELDSATVPATLTVTFAFPKVGFFKFPAADALGELLVADIGIPSRLAGEIALELATAASVGRLLPARPRDGHKGTFGKAMIAAGSSHYTGAPYLCAAAAARVGAGLVTLATTHEVQALVAAALHEPTFLQLPSAQGGIGARAGRLLRNALAGYDAFLIGPGLGQAPGTGRFLNDVLGTGRMRSANGQRLPPLLIDADGLNALSEQKGWWIRLPAGNLLTPHAGEFARLSKMTREEIAAEREGAASRFARQWQQHVLLKGAFTVIAAPDGRVTLLPFANPALATAGSGDVLSGIIVGLMAQGLAPHEASIAGGYVHGLAGELARDEIGDAGVVAGDLLPRIPRAVRRLKL
jgi:NAD(P)H-hydrate epimerase